MLAKAHHPLTRTVIRRLILPPATAVLASLLVLGFAAPSAMAEPGSTETVSTPAEPVAGTGGEVTTSSTEAGGGSTGGETSTTPTSEEQATTPGSGSGSEPTAPPAAENTPPPQAEASTPPPAFEDPPPAKNEGEASAPSQGPTAPEAPAPGKGEAPTHTAGAEHERPGEPSVLASSPPAAPGGGSSAGPEDPAATGPTGTEIVDLSGAATLIQPATPLSPDRARVQQRVEQRSCQLSLLGAPASAVCAAGWASGPTRTAGARLAVADQIEDVLVAAAVVRNGSGGEDTGGTRPSDPVPGPSPGGAAGVGVAAAGAGGAVGAVGLLTLIALALLATPRVLRRLRLSCRPYRTAFFVLIPERPG
jgi:hypothetical protein